MKIVKLLLIAVIVAGAIAGLLLLSSGDSGSTASGEDDKLFDRLETELSAQWQSADTWDREMLEASLDRLYQNEDRLGSGYKVLADMVASDACNLLHKSMMGEFDNAACSKATIDQYYADLKFFLSKTTGYKTNKKVKQMQDTYKLYSDILSFIHKNKNRTLPPNFDFETGKYNDFKAHETSIMGSINNYRNNSHFQYLSNITELKDGFNQVETNLTKAKTTFKNSLAKEIIAAFEQHEKSSEYSTKLARLNREFIERYGSQNDLRDYVLRYNN